MEVSNIANNPISFKIGDRDFLVKRLSLLDLFAEFEVEIKRQYMDDIIEMASRIKDPKERIEFQRSAMKDMPKGKEMEDSVRSNMDTFEGGIKLLYLSLSKLNKITKEDIKAFEEGDYTEVEAVLARLFGW